MVSIINNKNLKVLEYLKKENVDYPLLLMPSEITVDPYFDLGGHPEIVERLWDNINSGLPSDCRIVIYGTPALARPDSGVILALSIETEYAIRISKNVINQIIAEGASTVTKWSDGTGMDLDLELGEDWVFGAWLDSEINYIKQSYATFTTEQTPNPGT